MTKKIYSTDKNLMKGKRKRILKPTTETKIERLKRNFSKWELIVFECNFNQKYGLQTA